jgi:hypothetical protein
MRDVGVLAERDELAARDLEDRAATNRLPDLRALADRKDPHLGVGASDDDPRRILGACRDAVRQIARETRAPRASLRRHDEET